MPVDNNTHTFFKQPTEAQKAFLNEVATDVLPAGVNPLKREIMSLKTERVHKVLEEGVADE